MTAPQPSADPEQEAFLGYLRTALSHLYDPAVLRASPLAALFGLEGRGDRAGALQRLLTDAVEACRPGAGAHPESRNWRAYQVLRRRYIEQTPQSAVAADLGLSVRQLQREEKQARELLADNLWREYDLDARRARTAAIGKPAGRPAGRPAEKQPPDSAQDSAARTQELAWLRDHTPPEITAVDDLARRTLETAAPLLDSLGVRAEYEAGAAIPPVSAPALLLSQCILSMITAAARALPGSALRVTTAYGCGELTVAVEGVAPSQPAGHRVDAAQREDLKIARELARLAGGRLHSAEMPAGRGLRLALRQPAAGQSPVLIVDDNADAHRLYERLLANTRFRPVGLRDPAEAVALAAQVRPCVVLLDVMMPGQDGWALLGRLREHPETRHIPVIVCTILPQADLALTLGAAEFLRKPISRPVLLAALDRCTASDAG
jgi:CheY-like chemotaxis protein